MNIEPKKVWVVGHKNPDTDSICAAISYAYLKNQLGERQYVPKRAGAISEETRYVLDYFKVEDPELITDVGAQLKDISIRKTAGISSQISLKKAWETMKKLDVVTLPVTNRLGKLEGVIVTKDIATSYMDVYDNRVLSKARTQYKNIAETLDGNIIAGNEHAYVDKGYDSKYGARPLRRTIQNEIEDVMAEKILEGSIKAGNKVLVTVKDGKLNFSCKRGHNRNIHK